MRFGSPDSFAIEAELLELYGKWTYGKLRFWVGGVAIGDFDDTSDLATSARGGRIFLAASPRRTRPDLDGVATVDVYAILYGQFAVPLRGPDTRTLKAGPMDSWDRDPYLLDDIGESALRDEYAVVAVRRGDGSDRLIVKVFELDAVSEVLLAPGACDATVASYCDW